MKKILLSLALLATVSVGVSAQAKSEARSKGADRSMFMKELNLTSEQQEKMKALSATFRTKNDELRGQQSDLRKSYQADIKAILTPEQQVKWQEMIDKRGKKGNKDGKHFGGKGKFRKHKNVDPATTTKLEGLKSGFEKEKAAIVSNNASSEAQNEQMKALRDKYRTERKQIIREARTQQDEKRAV